MYILKQKPRLIGIFIRQNDNQHHEALPYLFALQVAIIASQRHISNVTSVSLAVAASYMHLTEAASVSRICHLCTYFSQYLRIYFVVSEKSCTFAGRNRRSILWYSTFGSSECLLAKPRRGVQNTGGGATPAYSSGDVSPEGAKDPFFRSVTPSGLWQNENGLYTQGFHPCLWSYQAFGL